MVTRIISGQSIRGLLLYNENKVSEGQASLILASRFGTDLENLDFHSKLTRFEHLTELKPNVKTNAIHLMLNFDRNDELDLNKMQQIAASYMERIGFGEQPYLVYKHHDASHPHLHIVTTNINQQGERMDIHGIGWTLSETARRELETEHNLIRAEGRQKSEALAIPPINIEKALYGKMSTKRAINNVVSAVMRSYKFTSLAEYNAILRQFNVTADRGNPDTMMFEKRGLVYSIIDESGKRIGIPFKASQLTGRPTLDEVEKKFQKSSEIRKTYRESIKDRIDQVLDSFTSITKNTFTSELQKRGIGTEFRTNEQGYIYGVTFVDHRTKCVFNGSDLGKDYGARALTANFSTSDQRKAYLKNTPETRYLKTEPQEKSYLQSQPQTSYLDQLLEKQAFDPLGTGLKKKKKRRKQQQQGLGF